jgi:hypothetical protein
MQTLHNKLQMHEKALYVRSCVVAEDHSTSRNSLNKKIRENMVVHMCAAEIRYK